MIGTQEILQLRTASRKKRCVHEFSLPSLQRLSFITHRCPRTTLYDVVSSFEGKEGKAILNYFDNVKKAIRNLSRLIQE